MVKSKKIICVFAFILVAFMLFISLGNLFLWRESEELSYGDYSGMSESGMSEMESDSYNGFSCGLFTNLSFGIGGADGGVYATAKNTFTLLPATVNVYICLYSSDTFQESFKDMQLRATNYTYDLDTGESITVSAPTNGEQKYWLARLSFRMDHGARAEKTTTLYLCDADGNVVY